MVGNLNDFLGPIYSPFRSISLLLLLLLSIFIFPKLWRLFPEHCSIILYKLFLFSTFKSSIKNQQHSNFNLEIDYTKMNNSGHKFKTSLCTEWLFRGACQRPNCHFAHGIDELQVPGRNTMERLVNIILKITFLQKNNLCKNF